MDTPDPLRIVLDESVHATAVDALRSDGHDAVRVPNAGTQASPSDEAVLHFAVAEDRILVTTDVDFIEIHNRWASVGKEHPGIVIGQQDPDIKRFLRNLRGTISARDPDSLKDQLVWIATGH